ncbi:flagellar basal body-associated FliL family protein [Clostridioides mangenotii]|uniref:flagellar basal body-associated FliL family protein n=1 Tax=Metaclostridioides mangenotii TaxID=1540 RepID=UPI002149FB65|nr:flagellar basal body-associated FliL family protein [Clostridioides mangenotii]MCR1953957.1 flagellar basal body-associated FliL family protein [Clostridioides mangenotii]
MKGKTGFFIIVLLIVVCAGAGVAYVKFTSSTPIDNNVAATTILDLKDEILVKLSDEDSARYLKSTMSIEYYSNDKKFEEKLPLVRDVIINFLMSKKAEDFSADNLDNLKEQLIQRLNEKLGSSIVRDVYFTNLVVQ